MDRDSTGETPSVLCPRQAAGLPNNLPELTGITVIIFGDLIAVHLHELKPRNPGERLFDVHAAGMTHNIILPFPRKKKGGQVDFPTAICE